MLWHSYRGLLRYELVRINLCRNGSFAFLFCLSVYFSNYLFIRFISSYVLIKHMVSGMLPARSPVPLLFLNGCTTRWSPPVCTAHERRHFTFPHHFILFLLTFSQHIWPPEDCPCGGLFLNGRATRWSAPVCKAHERVPHQRRLGAIAM